MTEKTQTDSGAGASPPGEQLYRLRVATSFEDVRAVQTLRFLVLTNDTEGRIEHNYSVGTQEDRFDEACDHLLVEQIRTGEIVGSYRLQTGMMALANWDYQNAQLFDCERFEPFRREIIEFARPCVHNDHRNPAVFTLLWRGIAAYAERYNARYLIGCHSVLSQEPEVGAAIFGRLSRRHLAPPSWQTSPWPTFACPLETVAPTPPDIDELLAEYLASGVKVCAAPALNPPFGTIEFLTLFDLQAS